MSSVLIRGTQKKKAEKYNEEVLKLYFFLEKMSACSKTYRQLQEDGYNLTLC